MFDLMPFDRRDNDMFSYFDSLGRSLFNSFGDNFFSAFGGTDIVDNGTSYELTADLPGFKKEEISVDINGDRLTISAEHKEDTNGDEKNYIRLSNHEKFRHQTAKIKRICYLKAICLYIFLFFRKTLFLSALEENLSRLFSFGLFYLLKLSLIYKFF